MAAVVAVVGALVMAAAEGVAVMVAADLVATRSWHRPGKSRSAWSRCWVVFQLKGVTKGLHKASALGVRQALGRSNSPCLPPPQPPCMQPPGLVGSVRWASRGVPGRRQPPARAARPVQWRQPAGPPPPTPAPARRRRHLRPGSAAWRSGLRGFHRGWRASWKRPEAAGVQFVFKMSAAGRRNAPSGSPCCHDSE